MKKALSILVFILTINTFSQTVVIDPVLHGILVTNTLVQRKGLDNIKEEQSEIKKIKVKISILIANINRIQTIVKESLTDVKAIVKQGKNVLNCTKIGKEIFASQKKSIDYLKGNIELGKVAKDIQLKVLQRVFELGTFVVTALTPGEVNMMSNMDRAKVINRVLDELKEIRKLAYEVEAKLKQAKFGDELKETVAANKTELYLLDGKEKLNLKNDLKIW